MRLHGIEGRLIDDRRHGDGDDLADRLQRLGLGALVELVLTDIGAPRQDAMNLPDAPASAVAGEEAVAVEMSRDVLHAHWAGRAVALQRKPINQSDRVGVQRIDFQLLFDLGPTLLRRDDAIANGRQGAVPETLTGILLQGPQDVLGVLFGLVLVEQRHDLTHHDVHGIVAHLLRNGDELDAVLGEPADVKFKLEVIAEEPAERMDDDDIEHRRLAGARFDHALEFGAAVVRGGCAGFNVGLDKLVAARLAIGFALPLLIWNGDIMLGLPRRRDAQIEGGAQRHGHGRSLLVKSSARPKQFIEEVAEPCLEHVNLGFRDRDAPGPVVGDGPRRNIMLRRPADAGPRLQLDVKIVGQDVQVRIVATVFAVKGTRLGHPDRIARLTRDKNSRILRHSTLRGGA
ncbi:MAG: hypothetical protein WDM86_21780 [Rhizomicrobium sp.]